MPNQFSNGGRDEAIVPFGTREMERPYDRKLDGRYDPDEAMRYRIVNGERICGWSCDPMSPYYKEDHHMCPAECHGNVYVPRTGRKKKFERIVDVCGGDAGAPALPSASLLPLNNDLCAADAAALTAAGVWLLIAVQSGPDNKGRRDGVRNSWKRWDRELPGVLVCFLLGRKQGSGDFGMGITDERLAALDAEAKEHKDILWLPNATDAGVPTIKGYHWWRAADRLLPSAADAAQGRGIKIAAKVDDDSFLHLGNLYADMRRLHCVSHLHYGSMGFTGYDPSIWRMCGWSWNTRGECATHPKQANKQSAAA